MNGQQLEAVDKVTNLGRTLVRALHINEEDIVRTVTAGVEDLEDPVKIRGTAVEPNICAYVRQIRVYLRHAKTPVMLEETV